MLSSGCTAETSKINPTARNMHQNRRESLINSELYKVKLKQTGRETILWEITRKEKSVLIRNVERASKQTLAFDLGPKDK